MQVRLSSTQAGFQPWRPDDGRVFDSTYSFDSETTLINEDHPWITPAYVLGAGFDGAKGYFVQREHVVTFFEAHSDVPVVMHNAPFDLSVIDLLASKHFDVYDLVDGNLVWDTQILHRLLMLGSRGHTASFKGESTLGHCALNYLDLELPKATKDSHGKQVRRSYGQWLDRPPREIEPIYLEYSAKDAMVTFQLYQELQIRLEELLEHCDDVWGYVSWKWLKKQVHRWGWQTHHIQLKAAIVLAAITANGMEVDLARRETLQQQLQTVANEQLEALRAYGYLPGQPGSSNAIQGILKRLEAHHRELDFPRTPTGKYATSEEALAQIASHEFVGAFLKFHAVQRLQSTFLSKMARKTLHSSFDVLKTTGRTSSFGEINLQNLPRDDRVRSCFRPSEGQAFVDADYATIEMATLAQSLEGQFQLPSGMLRAINEGRDLHRLVAARVTGKLESEVTSDDRQKAKVINFGKPGGMGNTSLKAYAKAGYGVELSDDEVEALSESWFDLFPEMKGFLADGEDLGLEVARLFDLTPFTHFEHTGSRRFMDHPENTGRVMLPHPILGAMCLKVLKAAEPQTKDGRLYCSEDLDFFWDHVAWNIECIPSKHRHAIEHRQPSARLQRAVMGVTGRAPVLTLTGRLRANASYCARHNTVFQGLAADGAKLGLWNLWRAGYRIVNFIHDEVLVEVPSGSRLALHAETIRHLMIEGMHAVVPDVRINVKYTITDRWYKKSRITLNPLGKLGVFTGEDGEKQE